MACWLVLSGMLWIGDSVRSPQVFSETTAGIRADGRLDFISPEGRVLASIAIEIADSPQSRAIGLMGRTGLDDSAGMLFVFEKAGVKSFWMRNTPTPLDIVFVSPTGHITHIAANTKPMSDTIYSSSGPALYVVEVHAGFCMRHAVVTGTRIVWQRK